MNRSSVDESFPTRISDSLTFALGVVVVAVLLVGGTSLALVSRIFADNNAVTQEYAHLLRLDEVHSAFDDLIFELHQIDSTGRLDRTADARLMQEEVARQLDTIGSTHTGELGPFEPRQAAVLHDLRGLSDEALAFIKRLAAGNGRLTATDLEWLHRTTHEVPRQTEVLAGFHRSRTAQLLESNQQLLRVIFALYVAFLVVGALILLGASLAARRRIAAPLRSLADAARGIAEGCLETRVRVRSSNEIGLLSHTFNAMAERLQAHQLELQRRQEALEARVREAQALHRVGLEISRFLHVDQVLQSIGETARELLRGDAVALCLFTSGREQLVARARSGPLEAFRREGDTQEGGPEEAAGAGARGATDGLAIRPEYARSLLTAPLLVGDDHIGTIFVGTRAVRDFTAEESMLLAGLAAQGAISIERATLLEGVRSLAAVEERERLAREMHDGLAQALGLLHLKLQTALARPNDPAAVAEVLRETAELARGAYEDVRQSIFGLRTFVSRGLGLVATLTEYLHEFSAHSGIAVELESCGRPLGPIPPATEVQAVRIIQEALVNVRKHSGSDRARVRLQREGAWVRLSIEDDGVGWDPRTAPDPQHFGLATMRERAEGVGGRLEIDAAPGRGAHIVAMLPAGGP